MFATLLETRAIRPRRTASSIASIVAHGAVIVGATLVTSEDGRMAIPPEPRLVPVVLSRAEPPKAVEPRPVSTVSGTVAPSPIVARLRVPEVVPVGIPPIDLTAGATSPEFDQSRIAASGIFCVDHCSTTPQTDASGNVFLTGRDLTMRLAADPVPPRYPEALRRAGVEGEVIVKFVVDTTGLVDVRTMEVVRSTHEAFTNEVRKALEQLRFHASIVGERKVKALAVMPFRFTLLK